MALVPAAAPYLTGLDFARLVAGSSAYKRAQTAGNVAGFLYRNKNDIYKVGKGIKRTYDRARSRSRKRKGSASRAAPSTNRTSEVRQKYDTPINGSTTVPMKELQYDKIAMPFEGVGSARVSSDHVYIRGIKICLRAFNTYKKADKPYPVMLHYAIIQPKCNEDVSGPVEFRTRFFKDSNATSAIDEQDFPSKSYGTYDQWGIEIDCSAINTRRWNVITHKKWRLESETSTDQSQNHELVFEKYFPIKRYYKMQTHMVGGTYTFELAQPFYHVLWWQPVDPEGYQTGYSGDGVRYCHMTRMIYDEKSPPTR